MILWIILRFNGKVNYVGNNSEKVLLLYIHCQYKSDLLSYFTLSTCNKLVCHVFSTNRVTSDKVNIRSHHRKSNYIWWIHFFKHELIDSYRQHCYKLRNKLLNLMSKSFVYFNHNILQKHIRRNALVVTVVTMVAFH